MPGTPAFGGSPPPTSPPRFGSFGAPPGAAPAGLVGLGASATATASAPGFGGSSPAFGSAPGFGGATPSICGSTTAAGSFGGAATASFGGSSGAGSRGAAGFGDSNAAPTFGGGSFGPGADAEGASRPPQAPCSTPRRPQAFPVRQVDELDVASSQDATIEAPANLQRFRIKATIGKGCFGEVLLAEALDGEHVAIKSVCEDAGRELREVELLNQVNHPCIVRLVEAFRSPNSSGETCLHIVMEHMQENLHEFLCGRPVTSTDFRSFGFQLLRSLAYLHGVQICHRDVKPENLLLGAATSSGRHVARALKLADFGSAKQLSSTPEHSTSYICARWWRAPELVVGCSTYSTAVDWWSGGCVLAEMMLGRPLFPGISSLGQLDIVISVLGTPSSQELQAIGAPADGPVAAEIQDMLAPLRHGQAWSRVLPTFASDPDTLEVVSQLLAYDPTLRVQPAKALCCRAFRTLADDPGVLPPGLLEFTPEELQASDAETRQELLSFTASQRQNSPVEGRGTAPSTVNGCFGMMGV